jgi:hypothetical protein
MVGGFLWVLRLPPQLKLAADIIRCIKNENDLLNLGCETSAPFSVIYKTERGFTPYW